MFGFLGGKEVQEAELGNLGLYDRECICTQAKIRRLFFHSERMALEWVQKYIAVFGGDPEKVIV